MSSAAVTFESLGDGVAQVFAAVADGLPVADLGVAHQLQFGEVAVAEGLRRGRWQVVDRVGMIASVRTSTASVLARPPRERAKHRTW